VIFFTPGRFKASIECTSNPQKQSEQPSSLLTRSCPAEAESVGQSVMFSSSYDEQQAHVWKFIPPIEVTVVEQ